jgi:hypothetical protein
MLSVHVNEDSFRYTWDEEKPRYPKALSAIAISELLKCGLLKGMREFHLGDRWILALKLAESLLQFHNGPWLQTPWTSENFFLLCDKLAKGSRLCGIHNVFVPCLLPDDTPSLPEPKVFDRYPLLLTFGQFLLELANGEKLPVKKTEAGVFSPYMTLRENFKGINIGSLSDDYKEAIKGCLDFQKFLKYEEGPDEEVRIRMTIFKKIVQPLERHLRSFSENLVSTVTMTEAKGQSTEALRRKDLHLEDQVLLANLQVSVPLPLRSSGSSSLGKEENGQRKRLKLDNSRFTDFGFSNPYTSLVSQLGQNQQTATVTKKRNVLLQSQGTKTKAEVCQDSTIVSAQKIKSDEERNDHGNDLSSSDSEYKSDVDGSGLLGTSDTEDSETQESGYVR